MERVVSVWRELKLLVVLAVLWGIRGGLFSILRCPFLHWARVKGCSTRRWHMCPSPFSEVGSVLSTGVVSPVLHDQRVLSVRSYLLVTVFPTCKNPPLENLFLRIV